jgi:hypothetical protein
LQSIAPVNKEDVLIRSLVPGAKIKVTHDIASIEANAKEKLTPADQDELLLYYGGSFWQSKCIQHCASCFKRTVVDHDIMVRCSGFNKRTKCPVSRHRLCFPHPAPSKKELQAHDVHYYCPAHMPTVVSDGAAGSAVAAAAAAAAPPPLEFAFTPPPMSPSFFGRAAEEEEVRFTGTPPLLPPVAPEPVVSGYFSCTPPVGLASPSPEDRWHIDFSPPLQLTSAPPSTAAAAARPVPLKPIRRKLHFGSSSPQHPTSPVPYQPVADADHQPAGRHFTACAVFAETSSELAQDWEVLAQAPQLSFTIPDADFSPPRAPLRLVVAPDSSSTARSATSTGTVLSYGAGAVDEKQNVDVHCWEESKESQKYVRRVVRSAAVHKTSSEFQDWLRRQGTICWHISHTVAFSHRRSSRLLKWLYHSGMPMNLTVGPLPEPLLEDTALPDETLPWALAPGSTILHAAVRGRSEASLVFILAHCPSAFVTHKNTDGQTAEDLIDSTFANEKDRAIMHKRFQEYNPVWNERERSADIVQRIAHAAALADAKQRYAAALLGRAQPVPLQRHTSSASPSSHWSSSRGSSISSSSYGSYPTSESNSDSDDALEHPIGINRRHAAPPQPAQTLRIRSYTQIQKLHLYHKYHRDAFCCTVEALERVLRSYASRACKPWFISRRLHGAAQRKSASARGTSAMSVAVAVESRSVCVSVQNGVARWYQLQCIQLDWAEFRSCCLAKAHADADLQACVPIDALNGIDGPEWLLAERCRMRTRYTNELDYLNMVREQIHLSKSVTTKVWSRIPVCDSCFRAVLGLSRSGIYEIRAAPSRDTVVQVPGLSAKGKPLLRRGCTVGDRVEEVLRLFCLAHGDQLPNPKGKDLDKSYYYVPCKVMKELPAMLSQYVFRQFNCTETYSQSSVGRARKALQKLKMHIGFNKNNGMLRCDECDQLDQKQELFKNDPVKCAKAVADKTKHLNVQLRQRKFFDQKKALALANKKLLWLVTLDGMDQAKTQIPWRARWNHALEQLQRLKVHVVGAFCFGGPVPVMGLLNLPDVRKDSSSSVCAVERIIDVQWEALEKQATQRAQEDGAVGDDETASMDAGARVDAGASYCGPGIEWPEELHLTFDNTTGECKNQWMMRFLGLLVLHGVFLCIAVCTLIVGHTHDIVDQMFSVWARMLRIHNAETLEKLRKLFHERYSTKIKGIVDLLQAHRDDQPIDQPGGPLEVLAAESEADSVGVQLLARETELLKDLQGFSEEVQRLNLSPHIEMHKESIDIQSLLRGAISRKWKNLTHLAMPHNFGIEQDPDTKDVFLYSKFLADAEVQYKNVKHRYICRTGTYAAKVLLYEGKDADIKLPCPMRLPALPVKTEALRKETLPKFQQMECMTAAQVNEFTQLLDELDETQRQQGQACERCAQLVQAWDKHGPVSRKKSATAEEKQANNLKTAAKVDAWQAMLAHLNDAEYAEQHSVFLARKNWWAKWLERVEKHIRPGYIQRGVRPDPVAEAEPYYEHPADMPHERNEEPFVLPRVERLDLRLLAERGLPVVGQLAVMRNNDWQEPLTVGLIIEVQPAVVAAGAEPLSQEQQLKRMKVDVDVWELDNEDWKTRLKLDPENEAHVNCWKQELERHGQDASMLQRALEDAVRNRTPFPAAQSWIVDKYKEVKWGVPPHRQVLRVAGTALVCWGMENELLLKGSRNQTTRKLKLASWRHVRADLCELPLQSKAKRKPSQAAAAAGAAAAAAAADEEEEEQEEPCEDEQPQDPPEVQHRRAAAAPHRQRPGRCTRSTKLMVDCDDSDDDNDNDDERAAEADPVSDSSGGGDDGDEEDHEQEVLEEAQEEAQESYDHEDEIQAEDAIIIQQQSTPPAPSRAARSLVASLRAAAGSDAAAAADSYAPTYPRRSQRGEPLEQPAAAAAAAPTTPSRGAAAAAALMFTPGKPSSVRISKRRGH